MSISKDVIYIDSEDDITDIISRVKSSESKIVALVPPKRAGVLTSVVNLRLLNKAAQSVGKKIVVITQDPQVNTLAGGVGIFTAENLQSQPRLYADAHPNDDQDDLSNIVDSDYEPPSSAAAAAIPLEELDRDTETESSGSKDTSSEAADTESEAKPDKKDQKKPVKKLPNVDKFQKKLVLIGAGVVLIIAFLIWAIFFAPKASVKISIETKQASFKSTAILRTDNKDLSKSDLPVQEIKASKAVSKDITATGEKNIGEKASGSVTISNCSESSPVSFVAGTTLVSAGGKSYKTTSGVSIPGASFSGGGCDTPGSASVAIVATEPGSSYNSGSTSYTISALAAAEQSLYEVSGGGTSGGSDKTVKIVKQSDIDKATQQLTSVDEGAAKQSLAASAPKDSIVIPSTFSATASDPDVSVQAGQQVDSGTAKATISYAQKTVLKSDLENYIKANTSGDIIGDKDQSLDIIDYGLDKVKFIALSGNNNYQITTDIVVGPRLDKTKIAEKLVGLSYGEAIEAAEKYPQVGKAEIDLSPFWVSTMPGDANKITITFERLGQGSK